MLLKPSLLLHGKLHQSHGVLSTHIPIQLINSKRRVCGRIIAITTRSGNGPEGVPQRKNPIPVSAGFAADMSYDLSMESFEENFETSTGKVEVLHGDQAAVSLHSKHLPRDLRYLVAWDCCERMETATQMSALLHVVCSIKAWL